MTWLQTSTAGLLILCALAIALLLVLIIKVKIEPFIALLITGLVLGTLPACRSTISSAPR